MVGLMTVLLSIPATAQSEGPVRLVDRLLAWVDEDPIFLSDVRRALDLGLVSPSEGSSPSDQEHEALDRLIDERLRLHEVERYESTPIPTSAVDRQLDTMETRAGGAEAFARELAMLDIGRDEVRALVRRQLRILAYVEERLGARIFVDEEAMRDHYAGPLASQLAERGEPLPPFAEVRDAIHALLWQIELNQEIEVWTHELRSSAEIVDLRDSVLDDPAHWPRLRIRLQAPKTEPGAGQKPEPISTDGRP